MCMKGIKRWIEEMELAWQQSVFPDNSYVTKPVLWEEGLLLSERHCPTCTYNEIVAPPSRKNLIHIPPSWTHRTFPTFLVNRRGQKLCLMIAANRSEKRHMSRLYFLISLAFSTTCSPIQELKSSGSSILLENPHEAPTCSHNLHMSTDITIFIQFQRSN